MGVWSGVQRNLPMEATRKYMDEKVSFSNIFVSLIERSLYVLREQSSPKTITTHFFSTLNCLLVFVTASRLEKDPLVTRLCFDPRWNITPALHTNDENDAAMFHLCFIYFWLPFPTDRSELSVYNGISKIWISHQTLLHFEIQNWSLL